jgi:hypothetical protein
MKPSRLACVFVALLFPLAAQNKPPASKPPARQADAKQPDLKKQLAEMETKAKNDAAALLTAAKWAKEKGLEADGQRLLQKVLKADPENADANALLGNVKHDGKWMPRARAEEAEFEKKGLVKVDGVWVEKERADDAKKGIFHHDGKLVSKSEKLLLSGGKTFHPRTGELIPAEEVEKAQTQFLLEDGRWVDEKAADEHHADRGRPWTVRTAYCEIISSLPLQTIEKEIVPVADSSVDYLKPLFSGKVPHPGRRPVIMIAVDADHFRDLGTQIGAEGSAYGAFLAVTNMRQESTGREFRPAVVAWSKDWGPYHTRHGAGLAYLHSLADEAGAQDLPVWFERGVAAIPERFYLPEIARHFGKQHVAKGGVQELAKWFSEFAISGDVENAKLDYNVYQAGLVLVFCRDGGDAQATDALKQVTQAFEKGKNVEKAIQNLEKVMVKKEAELRAHLQKITSG